MDNDTLKKLFYYCLKRTGGRDDAEDLSAEIVLEVLAMLGRGYEPRNFNAWLWTVARAKYAGWVKNKQYQVANVVTGNISELAIASDDDVEGLLLANHKDRYETDIVILDRQAQADIINKTIETANSICTDLFICAAFAPALPVMVETMSITAREEYKCEVVKEYIKKVRNAVGKPLTDEERAVANEATRNGILKWKEKFPENKSTAGGITCGEAMWFYLFKAIRDFNTEVMKRKKISVLNPKKFKGEWNVTGLEEYAQNPLLEHEVEMDWDYNGKKGAEGIKSKRLFYGRR